MFGRKGMPAGDGENLSKEADKRFPRIDLIRHLVACIVR